MEMKWFAIMLIGIAFAMMSPLIFAEREDPRVPAYNRCVWQVPNDADHAINCAKAIFGTDQPTPTTEELFRK